MRTLKALTISILYKAHEMPIIIMTAICSLKDLLRKSLKKSTAVCLCWNYYQHNNYQGTEILDLIFNSFINWLFFPSFIIEKRIILRNRRKKKNHRAGKDLEPKLTWEKINKTSPNSHDNKGVGGRTYSTCMVLLQ